MTLAPRTRLGAYEIISLIGQGGMGEVYRARDGRLGRDVAIKVLPSDVASDPDRLARFEREAQVLASLNHPNIAAIHGIEDSTGVPALVMELVEGPTLADRIAKGPIPLDEALPIAKQIAEALEAAHEQGIIHRDLKPANIKVRPDGTVKVLDFGLAKALDPGAASDAEAVIANSPTITSPALTHRGVILGTAAYMSPEQAAGKQADKRSDLWAFGVVVLEMLTGRPVFTGESVSHVLASVLKSEPDWKTLPANTPPLVRRLLRRCLEKERKRRLDSAAAARLDIDDALTPRVGDLKAPRAVAWRRVWLWSLVAAVVTALGGYRVGRESDAPQRPVHVSIDLPEQSPPGRAGAGVAISPDGTHIAYAANGRLYLRALDQSDAVPVSGSEQGGANGHARTPFFSPDNQWLAFWQQPDPNAAPLLKKVAVSGGVPITICPISDFGGGSWDTNNDILLGGDGVRRVPSTGGTTVDTLVAIKRGETSVVSPQLLPGGQWFLFVLVLTGQPNGPVVIQSRATGERRVLVDSAREATYLPSGYLVYQQEHSLLVQAFDLDRLQLVGRSVAVVDDVPTKNGLFGNFAVSTTGTLVVRSGSDLGEGPSSSRLVFVARDGTVSPLPERSGMILYPRFSPEGSRVAYALVRNDADLWVRNLARGAETRLTFHGNNRFYPVWTRDGNKLTVSDSSGATNSVISVLADGSGRIETLMDATARRFPTSWSPDGRTLAFYVSTTSSTESRDLWMLHVDGDKRTATPFLATPFEEAAPIFSPNGRWVAYTSSKSGQNEIYALPYPGPGSEVTMSVGGGMEPVWGPSGRELFYRHDGKLMTISVEEKPGSLAVGSPTPLFDDPFMLDTTGYVGGGANYDISPDGQRFVMVQDPRSRDTAQPIRIHLVLHWFEELKARVPAK